MKPVVGVDLGGTKVLVAVFKDGKLSRERKELIKGLSQEQLLSKITDLINRCIEEEPGVAAVGLGIPSLIDQERTVAVSTVNLPIRDLPVGQYFEERLKLPVAVDNDGNCAALAESRLGTGRGSKVTVCLTLGTGVGSGVVVDGSALRGGKGYAVELGHMVIDRNGPDCFGTCPNRGCMESMVSGNALRRDTGLSGEEAHAQAMAGNRELKKAFTEMGRNLGVGISSIINTFNPDVVAVGGGISAAGDLFMKPAIEEAHSRALAPAAKAVKITLADLGQEAGVIGAALIAHDLLMASS